MRAERTRQISIYEAFSKHEIGQELRAISDWLDSHVEVLDWFTEDIQRKSLKPTGRRRMSIESILRCGLLKQHQQWSCEDLAFHLAHFKSYVMSAVLAYNFKLFAHLSQ